MTSSKQPLIAALLLIIVGSGWLLNSFQIVPGVNWVWTLGLGLIGAAWLALGGVNKMTAVLGPFLIAASILSYFRQTGRLDQNHELPGLMVLLGLLILVSCSRSIPVPGWFHPARETDAAGNDDA